MGFIFALVVSIFPAMAAVETYPQDFTASVIAQTAQYNFTIMPPRQATQLKYVPNSPTKMGLGFSYQGIGGNVLFPVKPSPRDRDLKGNTKANDYSVSVYWQQFSLDAFFQKYKGFYVEQSADAAGVHTLLPDAKAEHYGAQMYYIFSSEEYSMASAYQLALKQTAAGGSWIGSLYAQRFRFSSASTIGGNRASAAAAAFSPIRVQSDNIGLAGGYGKAWLPWEDWFLSMQGLFGGGFQTRDFEYATAVKKENGLGLKFTFHFGFGWNIDNHAIGLKSLADAIYIPKSDVVLTSSALVGELFYLYRF